MTTKASTPPPQTAAPGSIPKAPLTPEQVRRLEIERLRAKARAQQASVASASAGPSPSIAAGHKRPHSAISTHPPASNRDARNPPLGSGGAMSQPRDNANVTRPLRKQQQQHHQHVVTRDSYIEYDFSKMTDTKGGFLSAVDDPHNRAMQHPTAGRSGGRGVAVEEKPAHMSLAEWERAQTIKRLKAARAGPFEPGITALGAKEGEGKAEAAKCEDCGSLEIDWQWEECFRVRVCGACKERGPERWSLLTKTEVKEDYLLTDSELRDVDLLPRLSRPNPHKSTYHDMQLFLRGQVEAYAFSDRKWGSPEALDEAFAERKRERERRREKRFQEKLGELKRRTRVEAFRRGRKTGDGEEAVDGGGEVLVGRRGGVGRRNGKHEHVWGTAVVDPATGMERKGCVECGMEVEELTF